MSRGTFAEIFGQCIRTDVDESVSRAGCSAIDAPTTDADDDRARRAQNENHDGGFENRGFLAGDDDVDGVQPPANPTNPCRHASTGASVAPPTVDRPADGRTAVAVADDAQPSSADRVTHPTSYWGTIFHLVFLSAGAPVLLIPSKFVAAGFVAGSVTLVVIIVFYAYSMRTLLWCAGEICRLKRLSAISYANLVYEAFDGGPAPLRAFASAGRLLISGVFVLGWFSGCVVVYLLVVDNTRTLVDARWSASTLSAHDFALVVFAPIVVVGLIRSLKFLEPCSTVGFACNYVSVLLVAYYAVADPTPWATRRPLGALRNVPQLVGIVFVNVNVTGLMISLKNEMKNPAKFDGPRGVLTVAYAVVLATYCAFSTFFGLKYGARMPDNAISVIPSDTTLSLVCVAFYAVGLYLLFPLLFYVPLDVLWNDVLGGRRRKDGGRRRRRVAYEYALRVLMLALALALAYLNPNVSFFVSLLGTVGSSVDSVILPAVVETLVGWRLGWRGCRFARNAAKNTVIVAVGACMMVVGVLDCVNEW